MGEDLLSFKMKIVPLTEKDVNELNDSIIIIKEIARFAIKIALFALAGLGLLSVFINKTDLFLLGIGPLLLVITYFLYQILFKRIIALRHDLKGNCKKVYALTIKQTKKKKGYFAEVIMDNGLKLDEGIFEIYNIPESELLQGRKFLVAHTPKEKFILNIKKL
jgi:hypothetical protein